jgi:hypothetical protein
VRPYLKNTQHKNRAGREAHVVKYLPSKCEALSLNPITAKKKKRKRLCLDQAHMLEAGWGTVEPDLWAWGRSGNPRARIFPTHLPTFLSVPDACFLQQQDTCIFRQMLPASPTSSFSKPGSNLSLTLGSIASFLSPIPV